MRIEWAAKEAVHFLRAHDHRLAETTHIIMQPDKRGQSGDVRDLLIQVPGDTIGISAKHRHDAVKHSRLSITNDFGKKWYGVPCSSRYWSRVRSTFDEAMKSGYCFWDEFDDDDKRQRFYIPVLEAWMDEVKLQGKVKDLALYLLGRQDYYRVIKANGDIIIGSFNMNNTLQWGGRLPMPTKIVNLEIKPGSKTTALLNADRGWTFSLRIHNGDKQLKPSLKFDVKIIGNPPGLIQNKFSFG